MTNKYFLSVGETDRQRLSIMSKLYNPSALSFLKNSGLQPGMTVLEIGCGTGHMACDLAKYLGPPGRVIAIDSSAAQIEVSKETAKQAGVNNIDFHVCNVLDLATLGMNYDATYGRWVIEFTQQPEKALELMYQYLNTGGILAYEATNMEQTAYFSCPHVSVVEKWFTIGPKIFRSYDCNVKFSYEIYHVFKHLKCHHIKTNISQAILITPEEKSVYRLGLMTSTPILLEKSIMTEQEIEKLSDELLLFEQSNAISGFFRNILISGEK